MSSHRLLSKVVIKLSLAFSKSKQSNLTDDSRLAEKKLVQKFSLVRLVIYKKNYIQYEDYRKHRKQSAWDDVSVAAGLNNDISLFPFSFLFFFFQFLVRLCFVFTGNGTQEEEEVYHSHCFVVTLASDPFYVDVTVSFSFRPKFFVLSLLVSHNARLYEQLSSMSKSGARTFLIHTTHTFGHEHPDALLIAFLSFYENSTCFQGRPRGRMDYDSIAHEAQFLDHEAEKSNCLDRNLLLGQIKGYN